jgi:peptide/nickel transport system substrate-binding protein
VYPKDAVDPSWALTCMPVSNPKYTMAAYSTEYEFGIGWGGIKDAYSLLSYMGAFAPPGQIPPLAQAIINGSLWTKTPQFAAFIGLPNPDPELQACVASYFHTTYTPVTTSTTTTAVTTTTTATTVTVTKPVISTALVIGIVVIVIVVAAVAALIALRRR